ncbi:MAG: OB-fold nucleic acid binding domain-containing protein [Candidatus Woesearchaeota archaeon]|nr:OB-fold nucleic acid binding domain-containing protein [Candidatus Woesearchaeota archaeon]
MRDVEVVGKVQQLFEAKEFKTETRTGKVGSFVIGDETGAIRVVLWGSKADKLMDINVGSVVKIKGGYVKENNNRKEVHIGELGDIEVDPEGEEIKEVKSFTSTRKSIKELEEGMIDIEILGTIVQVYDIKFFEVCPECGKRVLQKESGFLCNQHGSITPAYSYVFNVVVDDGTSNIRVAMFKKQIERLLNKTENEIMEFKEFSDKFEAIKYDLLGKQIKVVGRVNKNVMFDRVEFVAQLVFPNPDPEEEIKRLEEIKKAL